MHARVSDPPAARGAPALVLVHGLVVYGRYMVPLAQRLAGSHAVFVPDLPGFGRSARPPGAPRVPDVVGLSDWLAAWMLEAGLADGATLVGNSMGCQVIAALAVRRPGLVRGAVLQGPTMDRRARTVARQVGRFLRDATREPPSLLPIEALDYLSAGTGRAWRTLRHALEDPIEERLPRMRTPTLVVRGSRDPICPQPWADEVAALLPRGRLAVIPWASHTANYGSAAELARLIWAFTEGLNG